MKLDKGVGLIWVVLLLMGVFSGRNTGWNPERLRLGESGVKVPAYR